MPPAQPGRSFDIWPPQLCNRTTIIRSQPQRFSKARESIGKRGERRSGGRDCGRLESLPPVPQWLLVATGGSVGRPFPVCSRPGTRWPAWPARLPPPIGCEPRAPPRSRLTCSTRPRSPPPSLMPTRWSSWQPRFRPWPGREAVVVAHHRRVGELAAQRLDLDAISNGLKVAHRFPPCHIEQVTAAWTCCWSSRSGQGGQTPRWVSR